MPLGKQLFPLAFGQGVDGKSDPKTVVPGRLLELENGVFTKLGQIRKRNGFDLMTSDVEAGVPIDGAEGVAAYRDELIVFGGASRAYSYSDALTKWTDVGGMTSCEVSESPVVRNTYQQTNPSLARSGGLTCVAWEDSRGGVRYSITDDTTGVALVADAVASPSGAMPRVVVFESEFVIWYSVANNIFYRRIGQTAPTIVGSPQNPVSTLHSPSYGLWDVVVSTTSNTMVLVYNENGANLTSYSISNAWAGTVGISLGAVAQASLACVLLGTSATPAAYDTVYVVGASAASQFIVGLRSDGLAITAARFTFATDAGAPTHITAAPIDGELIDVFYYEPAYAATRRVRVTNTAFTSFSSGAAETLYLGIKPCGQAFARNDVAYVPCAWASTLQSVTLVVGSDGSVIAKTTPGLGGGHRTTSTISATIVDGNVVTWAQSCVTALEATGDGVVSRKGVQLVACDFGSDYRYQTAEIGNNLLIAGGVLHAYDGRTLAESGFHFFPEGLSGVAAGSGGSVDAGAHQWRVTYEWTDAHGQVHRSAPSAAFAATTGATDSVTLTIPTLRVTAKADVRIGVWRNEVAGAVFYRLNPTSSSTLENDPDAASVTYVDTQSDASITGRELLYTDGTANQELENIAPGAVSLITTHRGRAFVKVDRNRVAYSKVVLAGEPVAFNDGLYLTPDPRGGEITALASLDDKLAIFKERAIYVVFGDGPTNTGQGDYAEPQLVAGDVGCTDPRSVVLTPNGLMFKSTKGIYILDRALSVSYIGAPVEDFNGLSITSANVVPDVNQVRFTTSGVVTTDNGEERRDVALVYDYVMNQWSVFTGIAAVDATTWRDLYVWVSSRAKVYKENPDSYTDGSSFIRLRVVTSWLSLGQLQGFQRVYRLLILGDYLGAHSLRVRLGYDFRPEYTYDEEINAESVAGPDAWGGDATWGSGSVWGGEWPSEWFRVSPTRQKCSSMRIAIEDVQSSGYNAGFAITGVALLAGVKGGVNRMASARSV